MFRTLYSSWKFSTTLQILSRNRSQLKTLNKMPASIAKSNKLKQNLLPFYHMSIQYIIANSLQLSDKFVQLNAFKNKLLPNSALANGQDYQQYTLPKIVQICLKNIKQNNCSKQVWDKLQERVLYLLRNTSAIDNILLLYISINRFSLQTQQKILKLIEQDTKFLSVMEKQFLYYTLCQLKNKLNDHPHLFRLHKLRQELAVTVQKTKINLSTLMQWIILVSITNAAHLWSVMKYYQKVHMYNKETLTFDQFGTLLKILQFRSILTDFQDTKKIMEKGKQVISLFKKSVPNYQVLLKSHVQKDRIKMMLSYYFPRQQAYLLTTQQIISSSFSVSQKLKYLHWLWRNDLKQLYEIKNLYQSVNLDKLQRNQIQQKENYRIIDVIYYACWLELALNSFKNCQTLINAMKSLEYVPRGLQWIIWNYLAKATKLDKLQFDNGKQIVQNVIENIKGIGQKRNKDKYISQQISRLRKNTQIQQIQKFLHSIKIFVFKPFQLIGSVDFIAHFVSHQLKVVLNCLSQTDYIVDSQKQISNQHQINKKLLLQNFGYSMIDINVKQFIALNFNDRVQWLKKRVQQCRKISGQISNE